MQLVLVCYLTAFAPVGLAQTEAPPAIERVGAVYRVHCHGGSEQLADAALAAVESVWPLVTELLGADTGAPAKHLDIHLYRDIAGYEAAELKLTQGRFARNLAMAHHGSRSAHVALQPPCTDELLRAVGLPLQTLALLAWEATHLARYELCGNFASHPAWLCDGLAANVAQQVSCKLAGKPPQEVPYWADDIRRSQAIMAAGKLPSPEHFFADRIDDFDLTERYALRYTWFAFLGQGPRKAKLVDLLSFARRTGGGSEYAGKVQAQAKKAFGNAGRDFAKHLEASEPQWEEVYRSLAPNGASWLQIAFPTSNAIAWNRKPIRGPKLAMEGKLRILPGGRGQMNFLFGREERGFYTVAFVADHGFTVFDYDAKANSWTSLANGNAPALRMGVTTGVKLVGSGRQLEVLIEGLRWKVELPRALPDSIVWGLGAQAGPEGGATGSGGLWLDLKVGK